MGITCVPSAHEGQKTLRVELQLSLSIHRGAGNQSCTLDQSSKRSQLLSHPSSHPTLLS